ncbi:MULTISPECIES: DUF6527 family protein [Afipia]|uniref:Uncharacterized protein n=2 Tax=Afipia felis TaxID=1035 RepID=A0A380W4A5_AFIFE|nr:MULTISPECIES: DUF6527 family protein [Afipia]EFI53234.1 hypothetical protein AfiDRAFT_1221 [Afipia sp. 1NLS2]EKS30577.1 hypothetical protein HMPREF9697_03105 [Afipia felis ATCC 53690]SUU75322.1 Uncharacterised protein [Afipia felis]SUU83389.1 Uncharacterised protein [Afipia felis]
MTRRTTMKHCYVEFIPKDLDKGMLYISNRFKTASHLCCCGCGNKVVTPLNPSKWRLTDHGSTVSLEPSIGLGVLPCKSHYWIRESRIDWYPSMTYGETQRAQRADHYTSQVYTGEIKPPPPPAPSTPPAWWQRFIAWVVTLFKRAK